MNLYVICACTIICILIFYIIKKECFEETYSEPTSISRKYTFSDVNKAIQYTMDYINTQNNIYKLVKILNVKKLNTSISLVILLYNINKNTLMSYNVSLKIPLIKNKWKVESVTVNNDNFVGIGTANDIYQSIDLKNNKFN